MSPHRGAPLGNKNAYKHGFYSRDFPRTDLKDLEAVDSQGLAEEISLTRLHLRKLTEYALAAPTLAEYLDILRVSNLYTSSLNRLVKTQILLLQESHRQGAGAQGNVMDMLEKVLAEAQATWTVDPQDLQDLDDLPDPN
jgi:hypothetical protein